MDYRRLFLGLLFVCLAGHAFAGCRDYNVEYYDVNDGTYTAPQISQVVAGTATDLARATVQHGDALITSMQAIIGGTIGLLPGGAFVSGMFTALGSVIGGGSDPTAVLAEMYNDLVTEIENLRLYVDAKIEQTSLQWVQNQFGDAHGGLMSLASDLADEADLSELEDDLDDLYDALKLNYYHFAPRDDTVASYERTLPLFRQFADLFVSTIVSEIAVLKKLGKDSDAAEKVTQLQSRITLFEEHYTKAIDAIKADHSSLNSYTCCHSAIWEGWWAFATLSYYKGECTSDMDGHNAVTRYEVGCDTVDSGVEGKDLAFNTAKWRMDISRAVFVANRLIQLIAYWEKELKEAVEKWKTVSEEATQLQQAHLMNLSEEEKWAFIERQNAIRQSILAE